MSTKPMTTTMAMRLAIASAGLAKGVPLSTIRRALAMIPDAAPVEIRHKHAIGPVVVSNGDFQTWYTVIALAPFR